MLTETQFWKRKTQRNRGGTDATRFQKRTGLGKHK
ncbi:hypothetical protein FAES_2263 [Fibrella aestuarina BUZ 2]|uniref:Uncharacterized protein n=1 Tax=Fibrella aestuarina BUZ 2 TaxID=1166018 RepID=I0K819_9BACT|nr:hypothetical protein FAES_2263 [Fibrella aestuarina BUZ 2]